MIFLTFLTLNTLEAFLGITIATATILGGIYKFVILPNLIKQIQKITTDDEVKNGKYIREDLFDNRVKIILGSELEIFESELLNKLLDPVKRIESQLKPNGGGSVVDRLPRIEKEVEEVKKATSALEEVTTSLEVGQARMTSKIDNAQTTIDLILKTLLEAKK